MKTLKSTLLILRKVFIFIGLCSCLQFVVVGVIGLLRGYSVQGFWPTWIALAGVFCLLFLAPPQKRNRKNVIFYIVIFTLMYFSLTGIAQGRHLKMGREYYQQGRYNQALQEFKKETQTWYLRLKYNHNEARATEMMAKTYCQLEDFGKARDTYKLIIHRYPGFYGKRAKDYLAKLKDGLKKVGKYQAWVSGEKDFPYDLTNDQLKILNLQPERAHAHMSHILYDVARTYRYDLICSTKAIEVYKKILSMDIDEESKQLARECIDELSVLIQK